MSSENQELIAAMKAQTEQLSQLTRAISAMTTSNQEVIGLLTEVVGSMADEEVDQDGGCFLDGSLRE